MARAAWQQQHDDGRFRRKESEFRDAITTGGAHPPESGRYHLYVQYACPWAHRTLVSRALLGLEDAVSVDVVSWRMQPDGAWAFEPALPGCTKDSVQGHDDLQQVYHAARPDFGAIGTVPVLWDKEAGTIVNNESRDIIRMFDEHLAPALGRPREGTLRPPGLEDAIDAMIDANYESVNNGVYKCGFATAQEAYDDAIETLFDRLAALEEHMEGRQWLVGDAPEDRAWAQGHDVPDAPGILTEADVCLWTTLLRFDAVYHTHFKCNVQKIGELPNLWAFTKRLYRLAGVAKTVDFQHIRDHYYWSHPGINPHRIIARGPDMERLLLA